MSQFLVGGGHHSPRHVGGLADVSELAVARADQSSAETTGSGSLRLPNFDAKFEAAQERGRLAQGVRFADSHSDESPRSTDSSASAGISPGGLGIRGVGSSGASPMSAHHPHRLHGGEHMPTLDEQPSEVSLTQLSTPAKSERSGSPGMGAIGEAPPSIPEASSGKEKA